MHSALRISASVLFLLVFLRNAPAEPTSAIQFYDSTGITATAKFGWRGDAADGAFYIETPRATGEPLQVQRGNLSVDGTMSAGNVTADSIAARKIVGDGSGLTNVQADMPIAPASIDSSKLSTDAVTTDKIKNDAVTDAKIAGVNWQKIDGGSAASENIAKAIVHDSLEAHRAGDPVLGEANVGITSSLYFSDKQTLVVNSSTYALTPTSTRIELSPANSAIVVNLQGGELREGTILIISTHGIGTMQTMTISGTAGSVTYTETDGASMWIKTSDGWYLVN